MIATRLHRRAGRIVGGVLLAVLTGLFIAATIATLITNSWRWWAAMVVLAMVTGVVAWFYRTDRGQS